MLIGICGKKGAGKSTVARYLVKYHGFKEITFAEPLKEVVHALVGFPMDVLNGETAELRHRKETECDPIWGMTARKALQTLGTDVLRNKFDPQIWVKIARRRIKAFLAQGRKVVLSDVRFQNEYDLCKELGGCMWYIKRGLTGNSGDTHQSEMEMDKFAARCTLIKNDGSHKLLFATVEDLIPSGA